MLKSARTCVTQRTRKADVFGIVLLLLTLTFFITLPFIGLLLSELNTG